MWLGGGAAAASPCQTPAGAPGTARRTPSSAPKTVTPSRDAKGKSLVKHHSVNDAVNDAGVADNAIGGAGSLAVELAPLVERSIEMVKEMGHFQIVMFLGLTGAGKSTLINWLNDIVQEAFTENGNKKIRVKGDQEGAAKLGNGNVSTTKIISVQTRAIKQGDKKRDVRDPLHLADTQGFGDTAGGRGGGKYDIVNYIALNEVVKSCNSIRIVLVLSWFSIVKEVGKALRLFCEKTVGLLGKPKQIDTQHIMLVVTQTPEGTTLAGVEDELEKFVINRRAEEVREGFNSDVSDFVEKILLELIELDSEETNSGFIFSQEMVAKDAGGEIKKGTFGFRQEIRDIDEAANPKTIMNVTFQESSLDYLRKYTRAVHDKANATIECQEQSASNVTACVEDLLQLKELLLKCTSNVQFIDDSVNDIQKRFAQALQAQFDVAKSSFELQTSGGRKLDADVVKMLETCGQNIAAAAPFIQGGKLDSSTPDSAKFFALVTMACKRELQYIKGKLCSDILQPDTCVGQISQSLNNLEVLVASPHLVTFARKAYESAVDHIANVGEDIDQFVNDFAAHSCESDSAAAVNTVLNKLDRRRELQGLISCNPKLSAKSLREAYRRDCNVLTQILEQSSGLVCSLINKITNQLPPAAAVVEAPADRDNGVGDGDGDDDDDDDCVLDSNADVDAAATDFKVDEDDLVQLNKLARSVAVLKAVAEHPDAASPDKLLFGSVVETCATAFDAVVTRLDQKSEQAVRLYKAIAVVSNAGQLASKAAAALKSLQIAVEVIKLRVEAFLSSNADLSRHDDVKELASRLEELRGYVWLDDICNDAGVAISVASCDTEAASKVEKISTKLDASDLDLATLNAFVEQLGRLRVLGERAEVLFEKACTLRRDELAKQVSLTKLLLNGEASSDMPVLQVGQFQQIESLLAVVHALIDDGKVALDDDEFWLVIESANTDLAGCLVAFGARIQEVVDGPLVEAAQAVEQLNHIYRTLCAVFNVQGIAAMRGPIDGIADDNSANQFPCVRNMMDVDGQLFVNVANALQQRAIGLEDLLTQTISLGEIKAIKSVLRKCSNHFDKFLETAALGSHFESLRSLSLQTFNKLCRDNAKRQNDDLDEGLAELQAILETGKIKKVKSRISKMVKAFNNIDSLGDYPEQVAGLTEVVRDLAEQMRRQWDGRETARLSDIVSLQSILHTVGVLVKPRALSASTKKYVDEEYDMNLDREFETLKETLAGDGGTISSWIETVEGMIRRQDYENVDYQLSLLRRIVGKGTGSGVSGLCNFKAIVEARIMNSDGVGDAALIEGSRKYAGQIGVFGAALLRQLDGLLEGLRIPVDERGSQFATEVAKQAAKSFRQMLAASKRQHKDLPTTEDAEYFWKGELESLHAAVESALLSTCAAIQPLLGSLVAFRSNLESAKTLYDAGASLMAVIQQIHHQQSELRTTQQVLGDWAKDKQHYEEQCKLRDEDRAGTLEYLLEYDYPAYQRKKAQQKVEISNAAQIAKDMLEGTELSIEQMNENREHLTEVSEDVRKEILTETKKDPRVYLQEMDAAVKDYCTNAVAALPEEIVRSPEIANQTAAKVLKLSTYNGIEPDEKCQMIKMAVTAVASHAENLFIPFKQAMHASDIDALSLIPEMKLGLHGINEARSLTATAVEMGEVLGRKDIADAEKSARRIRTNKAKAARGEADVRGKELAALEMAEKAKNSALASVQEETRRLKEELEVATGALAAAADHVKTTEGKCILKSGQRTARKGLLKKAEAAGSLQEAAECDLADAKKVLAKHEAESSGAVAEHLAIVDQLKLKRADAEALNKIAEEAELAADSTQGSKMFSMEGAMVAIQAIDASLAKTYTLQFVSKVYSSIDTLCKSTNVDDINHFKKIFVDSTTQSLRELAAIAGSEDASRNIDECQTWATNKIVEIVAKYPDALETDNYELYNSCYAILEALKDVKQPPAVALCSQALALRIKAVRQQAQDAIKNFKKGDIPSDVSIDVADKIAILRNISFNVPHVEADVSLAIDNLLEKCLEMQNEIGSHKKPTLTMLYNQLFNHRLEAGKLVCQHKLFVAQKNKAMNERTSEFGPDYAVRECKGESNGRDDVDKDALISMITQTAALSKQMVVDTLVRPVEKSIPLETRLKKLVIKAVQSVPKQKQMKKGPANYTAAAWSLFFGAANTKLQGNREKWLRELCGCKIARDAARREDTEGKDDYGALPTIIASIFAVWTIEKSATAFENGGQEESALLSPKASQLLGIFRILGMGSNLSGDCMGSHLAQIRTGEGKSVTLGVLATLSALLGYDVDVVCYSEFLSKRDYDGFKSIFERFNVSSNITYGTFEKLADRLGDGEHIRNVAKAACTRTSSIVSNTANGPGNSRPKVLLLDEFDQVLSPKVYGQEFRFATKIQNEAVSKLMRHIYVHNLGPADWSAIQQLPVVIDLEKGLERTFVISAVRNMLQCRSTLDDHNNYIVEGGKIGYTLHDGINFEISYGYHTAFAYLKEEQATNVSPDTANNQLFIPVNCGEFSYAEILNQYLRVYGVSGTLPESSEDRAIVENVYGIKKRTEVPSIFGKNKLKFSNEADTCVEEDESNWCKKITEETLKSIAGTTGSRSVIVAFETIGALKKFMASSVGGQALEGNSGVRVQTITEETPRSDKERRVAKASSQGVITFITRALGRGMDFYCLDGIVEENGGVHVLQTFWSIDKSESIQIMGRTARQGQPGSYSLVLCKSHLGRLGFEPEDVAQWVATRTLYNGLTQASLQLCADANAPRVEGAIVAFAHHSETLKQYTAAAKAAVLGSLALADFIKFLKSRNPSPASLGATKVVIALDGTGSMAKVIGLAKAAIGEMLRRIEDVLDRAHASDAAYEIQIVVYRNYNAEHSHELLQVSLWQSSPALLADFLGTVEASYGWGNEAVELALAHANQALADLVIVIGDADAQTQEDVDLKRLAETARPWNADPQFATATYFEPEAKLLAERECPVSTFIVPKVDKRGKIIKGSAVVPPNFQAIASMTDGEAGILNIHEPGKGCDALTDVVCTQILECLGKKNGMDLVGFYQPTFAV